MDPGEGFDKQVRNCKQALANLSILNVGCFIHLQANRTHNLSDLHIVNQILFNTKWIASGRFERGFHSAVVLFETSRDIGDIERA